MVFNISVLFSRNKKPALHTLALECFKSYVANRIQFHPSGFQDLKILVPILLSMILTKKITYRIHTYLQLMMYGAVSTQSIGSVPHRVRQVTKF